MSFAVIRAWRKKATAVEVNVESEFADRRGQLRRKLFLIFAVYKAIELAELPLNRLVDAIEDRRADSPVRVKDFAGHGRPLFGALFGERRVPKRLQAFLRHGQVIPRRVSIGGIRNG